MIINSTIEFLILHKTLKSILMKQLLFACLLIASTGNAQEALPKDNNDEIVFAEVVEAKALSKGELYANAKAWISTYYKSSRVINGEDDLDGTINCKSMFQVFSDVSKGKKAGFVNYQMDLFIKDNRYKYEIYALKHVDHTDQVGSGGKLENAIPYCGFKKLKEETWIVIKEQSSDNINEIITALKKGMAFTEGEKNDNW